MTNNDILRRLRYALSISNDQMVEIFARAIWPSPMPSCTAG